MSNITCILDACTIINLVHIDEDESLLKKLKHVDIHVCETVFAETSRNVFVKLDNSRKNRTLQKDEYEKKKKKIDLALTFFRGQQVLNNTIEKDMGKLFVQNIREISSYPKDNGEFHSTVLAVYLTSIMPTKLFFHTDDHAAKTFFKSFYSLQQIGQIEDSVDLIMLLYRIDENFSLSELRNVLSRLFSEYATEVALLEKRLRDIHSYLSLPLARDKEFKLRLSELIHRLHNHNFSKISALRDFFYSDKSKYKQVIEVLELHENVFHLETPSTNLLKKISDILKSLDKVYCFVKTS